METRSDRACKATALVADPVYREHDPGPGHPESPARFDAAVGGIRARIPPERLLLLAPRRGTVDEVAMCHTDEYIQLVGTETVDGYEQLSTGDTSVCGRTWAVALMAVGGVLEAADAVAGKSARNAFCAVRPPGHHATSDRGMGFCVFNNVAIGARYVQRRYGAERVLIVDWDVHHGNGTQELFYEDPSVFYFSTHQWPFYPGTGSADQTGRGRGRGTTLNCPMASGSGRRELMDVFRSKLVPAMAEFRPDWIFVSAGFDALAGDPIGQFTLNADDVAGLTGVVMELADAYSGGRVVSVLEGGYDLDGLAGACGAHVARLAGS